MVLMPFLLHPIPAVPDRPLPDEFFVPKYLIFLFANMPHRTTRCLRAAVQWKSSATSSAAMR